MANRSSGRGVGPSKFTPFDVVPRAVTRALELLIARQPVGDAAEVRADGAERDEAVLARLKVDDPEPFAAGRRVLERLVDESRRGEIARMRPTRQTLLRLLQHLRPEEVLEHRAERRGDGGDRAPADDQREVETRRRVLGRPADAGPRMRSASRRLRRDTPRRPRASPSSDRAAHPSAGRRPAPSPPPAIDLGALADRRRQPGGERRADLAGAKAAPAISDPAAPAARRPWPAGARRRPPRRAAAAGSPSGWSAHGAGPSTSIVSNLMTSTGQPFGRHDDRRRQRA